MNFYKICLFDFGQIIDPEMAILLIQQGKSLTIFDKHIFSQFRFKPYALGHSPI